MPGAALPSPLVGADLRTDDTNVSELVRIANRWSRLSRVGLKAELCERGANPRQRAEFQVELLRNLEIRVRGPFYVQTSCNIPQLQICHSLQSLFIKLSWTVVSILP